MSCLRPEVTNWSSWNRKSMLLVEDSSLRREKIPLLSMYFLLFEYLESCGTLKYQLILTLRSCRYKISEVAAWREEERNHKWMNGGLQIMYLLRVAYSNSHSIVYGRAFPYHPSWPSSYTWETFSLKSETPPVDFLAVSCYKLPDAHEKINKLPWNQRPGILFPGKCLCKPSSYFSSNIKWMHR